MNNLRRYSNSRKPTHALLSVKPEYAFSILRGEKRYEFRRSIFARPVDVVLLYASAPVGKVIAEFDVRSVIRESVSSLWKRTCERAGIDRKAFFRYFEGLKAGHAIQIGEVRPYKVPFCPVRRLGVRPPQSFLYLDLGS